MSPCLLVFFAAAALLLAGCAVDQQKEVNTYRKVLDAQQHGEVVPLTADQALTLAHALALTNHNNEQLAIRGEDYLQALIATHRAAAQFLPTISLEPSYLRQAQTHMDPGNPLISKFVPNEATDVPIEARLEVNPLSQWSTTKSDAAQAEQRRESLLDLQSQLLLDTARTFYAVLRAQRQVRVLTQSLHVQQLRVRDIEAKAKAGLARRLDVSQSQAQLAQTRVRLVEAGNDAHNSRAALATLMGVAVVNGKLDDRFAVPKNVPTLSQLVAIAGRHRHDLLAARKQIVAAARQVDAAWGRYFPSVSLNAAYYFQRQTFPPDVDWTSLIQLHVPLFSAGMVHDDVRSAWSRLRQAKSARSLTTRRVTEQVRDELANLRDAHQRIADLRVAVAASQQAYDQAENAYQAGLTTNLDQLIAQDRLLSAQLDLAAATFDYKTAYLALMRSVGALDLHAVRQPTLTAPPPAQVKPVVAIKKSY